MPGGNPWIAWTKYSETWNRFLGNMCRISILCSLCTCCHWRIKHSEHCTAVDCLLLYTAFCKILHVGKMAVIQTPPSGSEIEAKEYGEVKMHLSFRGALYKPKKLSFEDVDSKPELAAKLCEQGLERESRELRAEEVIYSTLDPPAV